MILIGLESHIEQTQISDILVLNSPMCRKGSRPDLYWRTNLSWAIKENVLLGNF